MLTLRSLNERIEKEIYRGQHDIEPRYLPNQRDVRGLSQLCLDLLVRDFHDMKKHGLLRRLKKTQNVFENTLKAVKKDLEKNGHWSFWHYSALCLITCFAHLKLIQDEKHNKLHLDQQSTWVNPNWEHAVLSINYLSAQLFPKHLEKLQAINGSDDVDIKIMCNLIVRNIEKLSK